MNILTIPMTDWVHHPVPSGMNHYCDVLAERHNVYVLNFNFRQFRTTPELPTKCKLVNYRERQTDSLISYYVANAINHKRAIAQAVKDLNVDVILSSNILPSVFANDLGVPVVFDYRDVLHEAAAVYFSSSTMRGLVATVTDPVIKHNLHRADQIVTITPELCDYVAARYSIPRDKLTDIPCGVDTSVFVPTKTAEAKQKLHLLPARKVIGYVGSIEPWIDLETVIRAMHDINALLLIIGPGLHTKYAQKLVRYAKTQFGDNSPVEWLGRRDYHDLPLLISAMDAGINPLRETNHNLYSFGSKLMNYMACGTPVVSTMMPSIVRVATQQSLPVWFYFDTGSFVDSVERAVSHPITIPRDRIEEYSWRKLAARYESVLESAIRR